MRSSSGLTAPTATWSVQRLTSPTPECNSTDAPALACDGDHVQFPVDIVDKEIRLCAMAIYPLVERCSQFDTGV
jgi:hypothetical protein